MLLLLPTLVSVLPNLRGLLVVSFGRSPIEWLIIVTGTSLEASGTGELGK